MLEFLIELLHTTAELLPRLKFNKDNRRHQILISLYASIIEQTDSAVTLRKEDRWTGVGNLLRSALEAHVDLINLANDEAYLDQMMASFHSEWIKFTTAGMKGDNPYLKFFKDNPEAEEAHKYHRAQLDALRAKGPIMTVFHKFEAAGMTNEYRSIYSSLCAETHNNIRALVSRHFRMDETGVIDLAIFEDPEIHSLRSAIDTFIATLNHSNKIIHEFFGTDAVAEVDGFIKRRNEKGLFWAE